MKKMGKCVFVSLILATLLSLVGCMSMVPISEHSSFPADGTKYEILGRVTITTTKTRSGYTRLLEAAREKYFEADDVVNIVVDSKQSTFLFIFKSNTYVMSGVAIKYKGASKE